MISINKKIWRIVVFIMAVFQLISPLFSNFNNKNQIPSSNPLITPAGYAFTIWGVITLLALAYALYQILPNRKNANLHQNVAPQLIIVYTLFSVWLFTASKNWLLITVVIFVTMFYFLISVFSEILKNESELTKPEKWILLGQIAIYTGWTTVAIFANTASALKFYGLSDIGFIGILWQTTILIMALANSLYFIYKFNRNLIYVLSVLWAFVAIFFNLLHKNNAELLVIVVIIAFITVVQFGFLTYKSLPLFYKKK